MTYAERVGMRSGIAVLTNTKQDPPKSIIQYPKYNNPIRCRNHFEKTKETVLKIVSPIVEKLKVKHIKKISGNGILVETADQKDLTTLLKYRKLREAGFVINVPAKKCLRVICDVSRANNDEEIMKALIEQNLNTNMKEMLRRQVRVQDYLMAKRCYKCHNFGHTAKYCRNDKEICGHCREEGHASKIVLTKTKIQFAIIAREAEKHHHTPLWIRPISLIKATRRL
ncbi:uncharacterized protein LOC133667310 [Apis cerana]|uniref:uncharacterized protein LOC133667310 n=1 Tax=Apis cerana TaxID=7461 RepID=UPI002B23507D|nr:uncharacterized protein LOC133667310 [Apis cerana]